MPRTTPRPNDAFNLESTTNASISVSSTKFVANTDVSRLGRGFNEERLQVSDRSGRAPTITVFYNDIDELIAVLMRARTLIPEPESTPAPLDDSDLL